MIHRFSDFELDTASLTLRASGELIDLPPKTVELLAVLLERSGSLVTKAELMRVLWPDGFVEDANLTQHVYLLRRALRKYGGVNPIETAPRRGYCFKAPVRAARRRPAIAAAVVLLLLTASGAGPAAAPRIGTGALHAYQLGQYFWNLRSMSAMVRSVAYFRRTIALAPRSALGYAGLANAYTELADFEQPCTECASWRRDAEQAASRAMSVDPSSAEAHVAYGMIRRVFYDDDSTAAREFKTALRIDPRNALANQWYGNMLIASGRPGEGVRRLQVAATQQPISTATYAWLARGYYYQRRYAQAEYYAREALALEPTRLETTVLLGLVQEARGQFSDALAQFDRAVRLGVSEPDARALRAGVYAAMGRRDALAVLHRIAARRDLDVYAARDVVIGFAVAGDTQDARRSLLRIPYRTALDRRLILSDPHIRVLL
jgi:DNA-binding winged helix-turn-helix (wHTH) protein/Tfp pilus assembly protein PilF